MKTIKTLLLLFTPLLALAQYPNTEQFDPGTTWSFTNGAGIQNYGGSENYGTFNVGTTPYPNNSTVTITSPVEDYSSCAVNLDVSFELSGNIENGYDYMYFEYFDGVSWNVVQSYTGVVNPTVENFSIPNTATQFRFRLETDFSVNSYCLSYHPFFGCTNVAVYYYDITYFTVDCQSGLPVELSSFKGDCNKLTWVTESEYNNDYFLVEVSEDGTNFYTYSIVPGKGTTSEKTKYSLDIDTRGLQYFRLTQVDFDGNYEIFKIISVYCEEETKEVSGYYNILGQQIPELKGHCIIKYTDGTTKQVYYE